MGTPEFSVPILKSIYENSFSIEAVYTQPPQKSQRGQKVNKSPINDLADKLGINCRTPASLKNNKEELEFLKKTLLALIIDIVYNKTIYNLLSHYMLGFVNKFNIRVIKKIIYPGLYPKFESNIPSTYQYKFYDGVSQLGEKLIKNLENQKKRRVKLIKIYEKNLKNLNELKLFSFKRYSTNSFLEYPIGLKKINDKKNLVIFLFKNGFDVREKWYVDNSKFKIFKNMNNNINARFLEETILCLPLNPNFSENEIIYLCSLIKRYFQKN